MSEITIEGDIDGHDVTITIDGPEAQELDNNRIGADVLATKIQHKLGMLKVKAESSTEQSGGSE